MDHVERERRRGVIGIGGICPLCDRVIMTGESYLSGWGPAQSESVHVLCNKRRLGLDQSSPMGNQIHKVMRETIKAV